MRRHGAKQGNRMDYRMARHAAARHTGMRSVRRIAAAALGLALSLAGLSAQSVAFGNDDPTNPAATDVTMIAFQQSWKTIGDECTKTYGPEGVKYVQVSPPQESIQGTQWWTSYQPVSYKLDSKEGTEAEFKNMVRQCKAAGVGVIADTVINHTTGVDKTQGTGTAGSPYDKKGYFPEAGYTPSDFHAPVLSGRTATPKACGTARYRVCRTLIHQARTCATCCLTIL